MDPQDPYAGIGTVDAADPYAGIGTVDAPADPYADIGAPESQPPRRLPAPDSDYPVESVAIVRPAAELAKLDSEQLAIFGEHTDRTLRKLETAGKLASDIFKEGRMADVSEPGAARVYYEIGMRPGDTSNNPETARALALQAKGGEVFSMKREPDSMEFGPLTEAYRVNNGRVELDPYRFKKGVQQAVKAGVLTAEQAATLDKDAAAAETAVKERVQLLEDAGKDPKTKALLLGAGRGGVMLAGAQGGAAIGARVPGGPQARAAGAFVGSVAGALVTSAAERAIEERIAKHSETLRTFTAAGALEPRISQAGEIAAFAVTAPAAIGKLADATKMVAADSGKKAAAGFVAKTVGAAAGIGAATDTAVQGGMMAAGLQKEFSPEQLATTATLSALLAGHSVKFREYGPAKVEEIVKRGIVMERAKASPNGVLPDGVKPLSREESLVYNQAVNALDDLAAAGKVPAELEQSARQMLSFSRPITEVTTTAKAKPAGVIGADPYAGIGTPAPAAPAAAAAMTPAPAAPGAAITVPKGGVVPGAETVVFGARGAQFPARYVWANTSETQTSHAGEMMGPNPAYPLENTRDYSQPEERDKQLDTRNNFDPRRHVTDSPDASTGPRMAATIIGEDGTATRTTLGGNNRGWAIANLPPEKRAELRKLENAKAANFGLAPTDSPDAELQRDLGTFDLRQPGERERLQGIVDMLNPSPGMVQAHAKRAEIDAQNIAPAALEGMAMDIAPADAQEFVRGLIKAGTVDRNLAGSLAENPAAAQDYTIRLLANAAFRAPALAEVRMDARSAGTTTRGLLDAAVPALLRLRAIGEDGNTAADAVARTFVNVLKSGATTIQTALDTVARQTEFDPASIVSRVVAQGLQAAVVADAKGRPIPEPTIANAATLFRLIDRTVRNWQADQAQIGDLLGGRQETAGDAVIRAVNHFINKGLASASEGGAKPKVQASVATPAAPRATNDAGPASPVFTVSGSAYAKVPLAGLPDIKPVEMPELYELYKELTGNELFIKNMSKALGQFVGIGKGMVRLNPAIFRDPELATKVMAHEIGHLVDYLPQQTLKRGNLWGRIHSLRNFLKDRYTSTGPTNKEFRAELIALTEHWKPIDRATATKDYIRYRESGVELYADFISVLFNSPATAKRIAPKFFSNFFRGLDAKPEVKAALFELQAWLKQPFLTRQADRRARIDEMMAAGEEAFLRKFEERKQRFAGFRGRMAMLKQAFFDQYAPIRDRAADAGPTPAALLVETLFDSHPLARNEHWRWLERMDRTVLKPLQDAGFTPDDLGAHLFFDRIANESYKLSERQAKDMGFATSGRSVIANPAGHTAVTARQALLAERLRNGLKRQTLLEAAVQKFHDEVFAEMREAHKIGLFTDEQMALIEANRDHYAAFIPLEYIDTYVPAGISQQTGTMKDIASPFLSTVLKVLTLQRAIQFQRLKLATVDLMKQSFSAEIRLAETRKSADGRTSPVPPREPGQAQIALRERGNMVWYNVPREVAMMFDNTPVPLLDAIIELLSVPFRKVFYPLFITFNPIFQLVTNPIRDIRRNLLTRPMGIGWGAVLRQLPLVKQIGENPALDAVRALVKRGEQMPIIAEMLDNLAITPGEATFSATAGVVDNAFDRILQAHGLLPADEQSRWMPSQMPVIGKVLRTIQTAGRINELIGKVDTYQRLRVLGWNPTDAAAFARNAVGTPNFGRKGKHANIPGAIFPFFNIWTKAWATDAKLASKGWKRTSQPGKAGTSAAAWWMRWALVSGVPRMITIAGGLGLLGAGIKRLLDGIGDHDRKNYDVIPVGYTGASEVNAEGKVTYLRIPKDPTDRLVTGMFDNLLSNAATRLAKAGAFGPQVQEMNATTSAPDVSSSIAASLGVVDADVPGVSPLIKIGDGWKTFLTGQNPYDEFRGRHILSDDEHLAGGSEAVKSMLAWTVGQTGVNSFIRYNPRSETTTEILIDNTPVINGMLKVTDYGYRQQQDAAQKNKRMPGANERLALPAEVRTLREEFTYLESRGNLRTPQQNQRYQVLKAWEKAVYNIGMEQLLNDPDSTTKARVREQMRKDSEQFRR
jgi:hypothetical protein